MNRKINLKTSKKFSKNRKKVPAAQKGKGKQRKKVQYVSTRTSGESRKCSKDTETFGKEFGMPMIADRVGDG